MIEEETSHPYKVKNTAENLPIAENQSNVKTPQPFQPITKDFEFLRPLEIEQNNEDFSGCPEKDFDEDDEDFSGFDTDFKVSEIDGWRIEYKSYIKQNGEVSIYYSYRSRKTFINEYSGKRTTRYKKGGTISSKEYLASQ